jgi:hypothetical protein
MTSKLAKPSIRRLAPALGIIALALSSDPSVPNRLATANQRAGLILPDVRSLMTIYGADAVTIDRGARDYKSLDQVDWKSRPGATNQTAVVFGDPSKPGMYVQLLKRGPDDWSQPHAHPNDRYITVLSGTMLIGTGARFDKKNTVALGPGSMIRDIAGQMHYDGTGPEGLIIEIIGLGPTARIEGGGN